jgi:hypothetical protein
MTDTLNELSTVISTRRIPQLGEVAILTQRKISLLNDIELYGKAISEGRFQKMCNELAEIETSLNRYGGYDEEATTDDIADARREARFGKGL